jgi:hypothetical protein
LRGYLQGIFDSTLDIHLSPGEHGQHFLPSKVETSDKIINALTNLIGTSSSTFPLSSTTTGLTFDLSSGVPKATTSSAGPIFAERATTLGKKRINIGANFSQLNLAKLRGVKTGDIRFTFVHQQMYNDDGTPDPNDYDNIDLRMNLDLSASVSAFYATYGITDRFDLGVAIPFVRVSISSEAVSHINSYTFASTGSANHFYGGSPFQPVFDKTLPSISQSKTGLGDIALRSKFNFFKSGNSDLAILGEVRLATGDKENFLGTGKTSFKGLLIGSTQVGNFTPHLNLGYDYHNSDVQRNQFDIVAGYDQKVGEQLTLAVEIMGNFETGNSSSSLAFPADVDVMTPVGDPPVSTVVQRVSISNIPNVSHDNVVNSSFGLKYSPKSNWLLIGNVILPANDSGLRSSFVPTIGLEYNF